MATLYEMTSNATKLYELLQNEVIDEQVFVDTLEAMGTDEKVESYCKVIKEMQGDLDKYEAESKRISDKVRSTKNGIDRMKTALLAFMLATKQDKVKAGTFTVGIGKSKSVNITNPELIPDCFRVAQPDKINKEAIKKAISEGSAVLGAEIIENQNIRIR